MSRFKWYRRWKGGIWFRVRVRVDSQISFVWKREPVHKDSFVCKTVAVEDYATLRPAISW